MERGASETAPHDAANPPTPGFWARLRVAGRNASRPRRVAILAAIAAGSLIVIAVVVMLVEHHNYAGRVLPGVKIDGVAASGRHELAVYDEVARLAVTLEQSPLRARVDSQTLSADPSLLDLNIDARATAKAAIATGRRGNPLAQLFGTVLRRVRPDRVHLRVDYDESRLEGILDGWSAETLRGEVEGGLRFDGATVFPINPRIGSGILRDVARRRLEQMLAGPRRPIITLPVGTIRPRVDAAAVAMAARRARGLLAGNITLVTGTKSLRLTPKQLASALGTRVVGHRLDVTLDGTRLHAALAPELAPLERAPVNASFAVTEQNTVHVIPSRVGREIDMAAVTRSILRGARRVIAPVHEIAPRRDTKWARALGIVRQVGSFTTDYPSGQTRVVNIHRGADLLNNTVVEPGKIFSLNQTIGPRTAARGFVTAPVFAQGEFFDDYGGGVSQLATTTYNAAFFGGYKDITHQPHTIYISRYPPGREATVNYGAIDLQFQDDTAHGVLIRTFYSDTSITVTLYGDNDGRTAREENLATSNPVPVTDKVFQCPAAKDVDPSNLCANLTQGETEQASTGDSGFDVAFDRVIDQPGHPERREHYTWHYTMLPNQILVGTAPPTPSAATSIPTTNSTTGTSRHNTPTTVAQPSPSTSGTSGPGAGRPSTSKPG